MDCGGQLAGRDNLSGKQVRPEGKKSCGDKALIHVASPRTGLYQDFVFCT
jgi:hypothetical protein